MLFRSQEVRTAGELPVVLHAIHVAATITYAWYGLITAQALAITVLITPVCMVGMWLGGKLFPYASERTYRRIAYAIVAFSAIAGLPLWDSLR